MPRYIVEHKGKYASFSSIANGFTSEFIDKPVYEEWLLNVCGKQSIDDRSIMTVKEAALSIRISRTHEETLECMMDSGLSEEECEQIVYDMETEFYCPIPKGNGKFECPNCHKEIDMEQMSCDGDDCCLDFVWRD